jgi:hypothetical protein
MTIHTFLSDEALAEIADSWAGYALVMRLLDDIYAYRALIGGRPAVDNPAPGMYYTPVEPASGTGGFLGVIGNPPFSAADDEQEDAQVGPP